MVNDEVTLNDFIKSIYLALTSPPYENDDIASCPASALYLLPRRPATLIELAHTKIHSFRFSEVPTSWRRLYTDASILEAIRITRQHLGDASGHAENDEDEKTEKKGDWIQDVVRILDMAIIMTGAPERVEMIDELLRVLQTSVGNEPHESRPRKKRRIGGLDAFPSTDNPNVPKISRPLDKYSSMSMAQFERRLPKAHPFVIQNALTHWPALHERPWKSPAYLLEKTFGGRRLMPVELGRSYTDDGWGQSIVTFRDFMEQYLLSDADHHAESVDDKAEGGERRVGYLAQHDLLAQIASLRNDISVPDFCYTDPPLPAEGTPMAQKSDLPGKLEEPLLNAWFGPAGTVSPLHTDPYHNILCQVVGRKYVRLYSPHETRLLYAKGIEEGGVDMSNTSEVDVEGDEFVQNSRFPLFKDAAFVETILEEGESLYIPVGWWHYVRSLSISFSVSFWWN